MIKSPVWLRRVAMGFVLLGLAHLLAAYPMWKTQWRTLPLEPMLSTAWTFLAAGFWVMGSGILLGMLAESAKDPEAIWPGPLARGVANFLLVGGILAPALMWTNPFAWIMMALSVAGWWATRKVG